MSAGRNTLDDVVRAAARLFAQRGYHGTSMRDLGRELGLMGSSLYSHVGSKQDLLVEVVRRGAAFFGEVVERAMETEGDALDRLKALVAGHVDVVVDHHDEVRTYLYEAWALDDEHRRRVVEERDRYEQAFRSVIKEGIAEGTIRPDTDPKLAGIFLLSILNALERWYREDGPVDRSRLVEEILRFSLNGIAADRL